MSQQPGYVPGMEHFYPRPSWRRRHYKALWAAGALAVIAAVTAVGYASSGGTPKDYRDPAQLAQAVKAAEHAAAASCARLPTGKYICTAANSDGTSGTYTVTVSADGSSYTAGLWRSTTDGTASLSPAPGRAGAGTAAAAGSTPARIT